MTEHLITTRAVPATCHRCAAIVIAGHAEGVPITCDPTPVDLAGEISARLAGRETYDLASVGDRIELAYRDEYRIRRRRHVVLAQHGCSAAGLTSSIRDPTEWRPRKKAPPEKTIRTPAIPTSDPPPF